jgi:hypothetical protein
MNLRFIANIALANGHKKAARTWAVFLVYKNSPIWTFKIGVAYKYMRCTIKLLHGAIRRVRIEIALFADLYH